MKVLVVSDSHGSTKELIQLKERHGAQMDYMIHCGDSELTLDDEALKGFQVVRGNCDYQGGFQHDVIIDANDVRFFVTHGHLYNIKSNLSTIYYKALEVGANIVCFGHSHILGAELVEGILFLNPGSILLPRLRREKTYAILHIEGKEVTVVFHEVSGKELESITVTLA
ncbi:MAG: metallophosphoesterase family protein [Bacillaceae bacterium]